MEQNPSLEAIFKVMKKFPAYYGTRKLFTRLEKPSARRFILILSSHLRLGLPSGLFPSGFQTVYF